MKNVILFSVLSFSMVLFFGCGGKEKPILVAKPDQIPPSRMMTLSQEQLLLLDWHSPHRRGARVMGKSVSGGGVEFDVDFPTNDAGNVSLNFVSSGEGGRSALVGGDISGFRSFALKLTLVSINGKSDSDMKHKVEAGALIGPTAEGLVYAYSPVALSMQDSEKTVVAQTSIRSDNIRTIGFHIHAVNPNDWDPSGSELKLLVEPAPGGGAAPYLPLAPEEGK